MATTRTDLIYDDYSALTPAHAGIDLTRVMGLIAEELELYQKRTPKSFALFERAQRHMIKGVPCTWQADWLLPYTFYVDRAKGNRLWDVDGNEYIDFHFGDTPSIFGHSPDNAVTRGIADQILNRGVASMAPTEDAIAIGEMLAARVGLPFWYVTLSASDSNRMAINLARSVTKRSKLLMFNTGYHGTVDDTLKWMPRPGRIEFRWAHFRPGEDPAAVTKIAEFNDLEGVERALRDEDVAVLLTEPFLTDAGFTMPRAGWHDGLRKLCTKYGTLLLIDETHTQTSGPGGLTPEWGLEPDIWVSGKSIGAGLPVGVIGLKEEWAKKWQALLDDFTPWGICGLTGQGTTNSANMLCLRALRLSLEHNYTDATFAKMFASMAHLERGMRGAIEKHGAPFRVDAVGARLNVSFMPDVAYDALSAAKGVGFGGYREYWLYHCLNRGIVLIPIVNMILTGPDTTLDDCDILVQLWDETLTSMYGK
jgi:glutamate-1-semialdehyde 2,1-aminomutase